MSHSLSGEPSPSTRRTWVGVSRATTASNAPWGLVRRGSWGRKIDSHPHHVSHVCWYRFRTPEGVLRGFDLCTNHWGSRFRRSRCTQAGDVGLLEALETSSSFFLRRFSLEPVRRERRSLLRGKHGACPCENLTILTVPCIGPTAWWGRVGPCRKLSAPPDPPDGGARRRSGSRHYQAIAWSKNRRLCVRQSSGSRGSRDSIVVQKVSPTFPSRFCQRGQKQWLMTPKMPDCGALRCATVHLSACERLMSVTETTLDR